MDTSGDGSRGDGLNPVLDLPAPPPPGAAAAPAAVPEYLCVRRLLEPSLVTSACTGHLDASSPGEEQIVCARHNVLQVQVQLPDGSLTPVCERDVYGAVHGMSILRGGGALAPAPAPPPGAMDDSADGAGRKGPGSSRPADPDLCSALTDGRDLLLAVSDSPYLSVLTMQSPPASPAAAGATAAMEAEEDGVAAARAGPSARPSGSGRPVLKAVCQVPLVPPSAPYGPSVHGGLNMQRSDVNRDIAADDTSRYVAVAAMDGRINLYAVRRGDARRPLHFLHSMVDRQEATEKILRLEFLPALPDDPLVRLLVHRRTASKELLLVHTIEPTDPIRVHCKQRELPAGALVVPQNPIVVVSTLPELGCHLLKPNLSQHGPNLSCTSEVKGRGGPGARARLSFGRRSATRSRVVFVLTDSVGARLVALDASPTLGRRFLELADLAFVCCQLVPLENGDLMLCGRRLDGAVFSPGSGPGRMERRATVPAWGGPKQLTLSRNSEQGDEVFALSEGGVVRIRNGVGITRLGSTGKQFQGASAMWAFPRTPAESKDAYIVYSFVESTRIHAMNGMAFSDLSTDSGLDLDVNTLHAGVTVSGYLVQVQASCVLFALPGTSERAPRLLRWHASEGQIISVASLAGSVLLLFHPRSKTLCALQFCLGDGEPRVELVAAIELEHELSCLCTWPILHSAGPSDGSVYFSAGTYEPGLVVGSLDLASCALHVLHRLPLAKYDGDARIGPPESVQVLAAGGQESLFVGRRDGSVLQFALLAAADQGIQIGLDPARLRAGNKPVTLAPFPGNKLLAVSARGQLSLVHTVRGRTTVTPVDFRHPVSMARGCRSDIPGSIMLVISEDELHIADLDVTKQISWTHMHDAPHATKLALLRPGRLVAMHSDQSAPGVEVLDAVHGPSLSFWRVSASPVDVAARDPFVAVLTTRNLLMLRLVDDQLALVDELEFSANLDTGSPRSVHFAGDGSVLVTSEKMLTIVPWLDEKGRFGPRRPPIPLPEGGWGELLKYEDGMFFCRGKQETLVYSCSPSVGGLRLAFSSVHEGFRHAQVVGLLSPETVMFVDRFGGIFTHRINRLDEEQRRDPSLQAVEDLAYLSLLETPCEGGLVMGRLNPDSAPGAILATGFGSLYAISCVDSRLAERVLVLQELVAGMGTVVLSPLLGHDPYVVRSATGPAMCVLDGVVLQEFLELSPARKAEVATLMGLDAVGFAALVADVESVLV